MLTPRDWHYIENSSNAALRYSLGDALENCDDELAEEIRQELARRLNESI